MFSKKCVNTSGVYVPNNYFGFQYPRTGDNYAGIFGGGTSREYISVKLTAPLIASRFYCVRLFVNLSNNSKYGFNNFEVCFSNDTLRPIGTSAPLYNYTPQLTSSWNNVICDTLNWVLLEWQYQAQGNEAYITFGNFKADGQTNIQTCNNTVTNGMYYYIDDISIIDINTPAYAGRDTMIAPGDSVFIGRTPEIGLNDDCFWFINGNPIDTVAGMWVTPDTTTTYILKQDICGTVNYDTVTVTVQPSGNDELGVVNDELRVYPNPAQTSISIACKNAGSQAVLQISDVLGNVVLHQPLTKDLVDIKGLSSGVYFVSIVGSSSIQCAKFFKD